MAEDKDLFALRELISDRRSFNSSKKSMAMSSFRTWGGMAELPSVLLPVMLDPGLTQGLVNSQK